MAEEQIGTAEVNDSVAGDIIAQDQEFMQALGWMHEK